MGQQLTVVNQGRKTKEWAAQEEAAPRSLHHLHHLPGTHPKQGAFTQQRHRRDENFRPSGSR